MATEHINCKSGILISVTPSSAIPGLINIVIDGEAYNLTVTDALDLAESLQRQAENASKGKGHR